MAASIPSRVGRTISAFNPSTRTWQSLTSALASCSKQAPKKTTQRFTLTSWNIDAFSPRAVSRARLILDHILHASRYPDIIFLQEVTSSVCDSLLNDPRVRAEFLATDAEDRTSFKGVPFATMTLLSRATFCPDAGLDRQGAGIVSRVSRIPLPSEYRRDALCVDVLPSGAPSDRAIRLINVHLDSLWHTLHYRTQQLHMVASMLREPGYSGGVIAGDFNAIRPEDDELVDKTKLVDAWVALNGTEDDDGATWGLDSQRRSRFGPRRLDKVAMTGLRAEAIQVMKPGRISIPKPGGDSSEMPWSDHSGLRCTFSTN